MRLALVSNTETFIGVRIALTVGERQRIMNQLESLKSSADQHFHLTADGEGAFLDVEVGVQGSGERSNAAMTGFAIEPDAHHQALDQAADRIQRSGGPMVRRSSVSA